jgi:putative ATP-dependent endonuclease of OLD family
MKLREIVVKNFRCLVDVKIPIDDLTVLVGENNTGKTALLEALKIALPRNQASRKDPFEEYDYHMSKAGDSPRTSERIIIELCFREDERDKWPDELRAALTDIIQPEDLNFIKLRLSSGYDPESKEMRSDWEFLNRNGDPLLKNSPALLANFLRYVRLFYLSALRDADAEFSPRSQFWGAILKDLKIGEETEAELKEALQGINEKVLGADERLKKIKDSLEKIQKVMASETGGRTTIQSVPLKTWDLMSRAQVVVQGRGGEVDFPLSRHGQGIQSLSILFLFQAYIDVLLKPSFEAETEAILALEEPEAHLHPQAVRALAASIKEITSQKIVSTHSPYFIQDVPFENIRLFRRDGAGTKVLYITEADVSELKDELAKLETNAKRIRGEIFFARGWLLCEGQSEYLLLRYFAELLGKSLDSHGISVIDFQNNGSPGAFVGLAKAFEVPWILICDNDDASTKFETQVKKYGAGDEEILNLFKRLPTKDGWTLEHFLFQNFKSEFLYYLKSSLKVDETCIAFHEKKKDKKREFLRKIYLTGDNYEIHEENTLGSDKRILRNGDPEFEEIFCATIAAHLQKDKVGSANALICNLQESKADKSRVPDFFADAIHKIIELAEES